MNRPFGENLETVLLVEDHSALLKLVKQILENAGFSVICAKSGKEAMRLEAEFPGTIDLLLSDVRMRGTSGPELAMKLQKRRPQMRVILMSGYPGGSLVLQYGWHYIEKPFEAGVLVSKINDILRPERRDRTGSRFDLRTRSRRPLGSESIHFSAAASRRRA